MGSYYIRPLRPEEIYHYGMPERSGRYAWGSGDRPYQRLEGKVSLMENRLRKRMTKADKKIKKKQDIANKKYETAIRKSNSIFSSKRSERKAFEKATNAQRRANKEEYKVSKYYQKYEKKFRNLNVTMDQDLRQKGMDYYNKVINNSKQSYQIALNRKIGR